jgi:pilus assembly protein CpaF
MLKSSGRRVDLSSPFVDAALPDGSRLHVVIPDITRSDWAVNIRKFTVRATSLDDLVTLGTLSPPMAHFLTASVIAGLNILVSGGTQVGKTTMLNCLLGAIPARDRVITCEEVFELRVPVRDTVAMQCRQPSLEGTGEVPLRRLIKEALRMRPARIVVGEVRQAESLDLLLALNSGLPGMCTLHANSAREAIVKMCTLPLLAGENVQMQLDADGRRRVSEIIGVPGRVEGDVIETADIFSRRGDRVVRAEGFPPHVDRYQRAGIDITGILQGGWR